MPPSVKNWAEMHRSYHLPTVQIWSEIVKKKLGQILLKPKNPYLLCHNQGWVDTTAGQFAAWASGDKSQGESQ